MATTVWCLIIDYKKQPIGWPFEVAIENDTLNVAGFKKKVKEESQIVLPANQLILWQLCKELKVSADEDDEELEKHIKNIDFTDKKIAVKLASTKKMKNLEFSENETLLVQLPYNHDTVRGVTEQEQGAADTVPELPEVQRFNKTVGNKGRAPSEGAKFTEYRSVQRDPSQAIYDGRAPLRAPFSTIAPPINIFHPIFDEFISMVNDPTQQPTTEDLLSVQEFMRTTSILYDSELDYSRAVNPILETILGLSLMNVGNAGDKVTADRAIIYRHIVLLLEELKQDPGASGCDPSTQAGISMRRYWIDSSRKSIREKCCCPTFMIAAAGPWLCVMGGVFTDRVIIQRLTDWKWTALSSTEEEFRVVNNARIFVALRNCLHKLKDFYDSPAFASIPPLLASVPHPRFFPHLTYYTENNGRHVTFKYIRPLEKDEPTCITFLGEITSDNEPKKVVIKFVTRYGRDAHDYLASKGKAPKLHYFGQIPGGPAVLPGLDLSGVMQVAIMDYIDSKTTPPWNAREKVEEILTDLHSEGYVFGDLRRPNILFDQTDKAFLIDFNWCGRYDMNMKHDGIPQKVRECITEKLASGGLVDGKYARYPLAVSQVAGMWVDGVKPRGLILPEHDWAMLKKLDF